MRRVVVWLDNNRSVVVAVRIVDCVFIVVAQEMSFSSDQTCDATLDMTVDGACSPVVTVTLHPAGHLTVLTEIGSL